MLLLTKNLQSIFRKKMRIFDSSASVLNHLYVMKTEFITMLIISS